MAILKPSEIDCALSEVSSDIFAIRSALHRARQLVSGEAAKLANIPTVYADLLETVNAVGYSGDAYKDGNKARLAALTAEFLPLQTQANSSRDYLDANITEF